jgi:hypothetical protein
VQELAHELVKGGISVVVTLIGLGAGWLVGQRLTYQWNLRQKRRESELATAQDLQRLYGEFFAVWKVWDRVASDVEPSVYRDLLQQAAEAEGLLERVLVKLATERRLAEADKSTLCRFRQGYQQLRRAIKSGTPLGWKGADDPRYRAFKRLVVTVTLLVQRDGGMTKIGADEAFFNLREITSDQYRDSWPDEK